MTSSEQLIYHESLDCALKVAYIDPNPTIIIICARSPKATASDPYHFAPRRYA